jgi:hypothetical protein
VKTRIRRWAQTNVVPLRLLQKQPGERKNGVGDRVRFDLLDNILEHAGMRQETYGDPLGYRLRCPLAIFIVPSFVIARLPPVSAWTRSIASSIWPMLLMAAPQSHRPFWPPRCLLVVTSGVRVTPCFGRFLDPSRQQLQIKQVDRLDG